MVRAKHWNRVHGNSRSIWSRLSWVSLSTFIDFHLLTSNKQPLVQSHLYRQVFLFEFLRFPDQCIDIWLGDMYPCDCFFGKGCRGFQSGFEFISCLQGSTYFSLENFLVIDSPRNLWVNDKASQRRHSNSHWGDFTRRKAYFRLMSFFNPTRNMGV